MIGSSWHGCRLLGRKRWTGQPLGGRHKLEHLAERLSPKGIVETRPHGGIHHHEFELHHGFCLASMRREPRLGRSPACAAWRCISSYIKNLCPGLEVDSNPFVNSTLLHLRTTRRSTGNKDSPHCPTRRSSRPANQSGTKRPSHCWGNQGFLPIKCRHQRTPQPTATKIAPVRSDRLRLAAKERSLRLLIVDLGHLQPFAGSESGASPRPTWRTLVSLTPSWGRGGNSLSRRLSCPRNASHPSCPFLGLVGF